MPSVHKFIGYFKQELGFVYWRQIQLIIKPTYENQPMRSNGLNFVGTDFRGSFPVRQRVAIAPSSSKSMSFSQLVSQISPNNSRIIFVSSCKGLGIFKKHILRKLSAPPQSIAVIIRAAPLRSTSMVVQNDHQAYLR